MNEIEAALAAISDELKHLAPSYFRGGGPDCDLYNHLFAYMETALCGYVHRLGHNPTAAVAQEFLLATADFDSTIIRYRLGEEPIARPLRYLIERFEALHALMQRELGNELSRSRR